MHRIIAIARRKRVNKKKYYDSDECVSSDDEVSVSKNNVGSIINNRYLILKYIGTGTFSKVWLVYDLYFNKYYALKKQYAEYYKDGLHELKMINIIGNECEYLVKVYDSFIITEKESNYVCIVCELQGIEIFEFVKKYDYKLPIYYVKKIIQNTLKGLEHLHNKNIIHTDLKLENILSSILDDKVKNIIEWFESLSPLEFIKENSIVIDELSSQKKRKMKKRLKRKAYKKLGEKVKKYLSEQIKNTNDDVSDDIIEINNNTEIPIYNINNDIKEVDFEYDFHTKICDFGNCCTRDNHIICDIQTRQYRSPEVIINDDYDISSDIWSLGCLLYELITGYYIFDVESGKNELDRNRKHIALMYEVLGKMPKNISLNCKYSEKFFDLKGRVLKYKKDINYTSIEKLILEERNDIDETELNIICDLIRKMLDYDPNKRITAKESLEHEWFKL